MASVSSIVMKNGIVPAVRGVRTDEIDPSSLEIVRQVVTGGLFDPLKACLPRMARRWLGCGDEHVLPESSRLRALRTFCVRYRAEDARCIDAGTLLMERFGYRERELSRICEILDDGLVRGAA